MWFSQCRFIKTKFRKKVKIKNTPATITEIHKKAFWDNISKCYREPFYNECGLKIKSFDSLPEDRPEES